MNIIGISGRRDDESSAGAGKDEVAKILARKHHYVIVSFADEIKRTAMRWYDFSVEQLWGSKKEEPDLRYPREHGPFVRSWVSQDYWKDNWTCACCGHPAVSESIADEYQIHYVSKDAPQCYLTPRWACRAIGTDVGRAIYSDTWVRIAIFVAKTLVGGFYEESYAQDYTAERGLHRARNLDRSYRRPTCIVIPDVRWPTGNEGKAVKAAGGVLWLVERPGTSQTGVATHESETQPIPDDVFDCIIYNDCSLVSLEIKVDAAMAAAKETP